MKRKPELRILSVDHHHGLVAARRLRLAAEAPAAHPEALAAFLAAWRNEIEPHFRVEEEELLPRYAAAAGEAAPLLRRTLREHAELRERVRALEPGDTPPSQWLEAATALERHIRFEERELFPAVENALPDETLTALAEALARYERTGCRITSAP
jgi:hemerythrin-like domain-containing protein